MKDALGQKLSAGDIAILGTHRKQNFRSTVRICIVLKTNVRWGSHKRVQIVSLNPLYAAYSGYSTDNDLQVGALPTNMVKVPREAIPAKALKVLESVYESYLDSLKREKDLKEFGKKIRDEIRYV